MQIKQTLADLYCYGVDAAYDFIDRHVYGVLIALCIAAVILIVAWQLYMAFKPYTVGG
jgi:hypothetical protein